MERISDKVEVIKAVFNDLGIDVEVKKSKVSQSHYFYFDGNDDWTYNIRISDHIDYGRFAQWNFIINSIDKVNDLCKVVKDTVSNIVVKGYDYKSIQMTF